MTSSGSNLIKGPLKRYLENFASVVTRNEEMRKWIYYSSRFPKLGLMAHDTIRTDTEFFKEVRSRLPKDLAAERQFRISRALYLDSKQQILPKEEWMTLDKEEPYMTPYLEMVEKEFEEKKYYQKKIYKPFYKLQNMF